MKHRRRWLILIATCLIIGLLVSINLWQRSRPGTPVSSDTVTQTALEAMSDVFDTELSGYHVNTSALFAEALASIRPEARAAESWPNADYALLRTATGKGSEQSAVPMVFELGSVGRVCAEAQVNLSDARILLTEIICPSGIPTVLPSSASAPENRAEYLAQALNSRNSLTLDESPTGSAQSAFTFLFQQRPEATSECTPHDLESVFDSGNAAGNTDEYQLRVQNISTSPCRLNPLESLSVDQGNEILTPQWKQSGSAVILHPLESAGTQTSYRPHQVAMSFQKFTAGLPSGPLQIRRPPGVIGTVLAIKDTSQITADPWQVLGYGIAQGDHGRALVDIAAPCLNRQLIITTPVPDQPEYDDPYVAPTPYFLINIGTTACRLNPGIFRPLGPIPDLGIISTTVLRPSEMATIQFEDGAEDLSGTLIIDGKQLDLN